MVDGHGARHVDDAALDGAVGRRLVAALETPAGAGVDDGAAADLAHLGDDVLAHEEEALETHVKNEVPFLLFELVDGLADGDARVVVQDVDAAELCDDGIDGIDHALLVGDVALEEGGVAAGVAQLLRGSLRFGTHVDDGNARAVGGEHLRNAEANAGTGACDNCNLTGKVQRISLLNHNIDLLSNNGRSRESTLFPFSYGYPFISKDRSTFSRCRKKIDF